MLKNQMPPINTTKNKEKQGTQENVLIFEEPEAAKILKSYNIPYPPHGSASSWKEAVQIAEQIGYPVVLKIVSPDIIHKSDVGGVVVGIQNAMQVRRGFSQIIDVLQKKIKDAHIKGILVCKQAPPGVEVIIGALEDSAFGPTIMFGLGGLFTEALGDVSFRIAPLDRQEAQEMIREIKGYPLLAGARGRTAIDEQALVELLLTVFRIVVDRPEIKQLDLNPVRVYNKGLMVLDARIMLNPLIRNDRHLKASLQRSK